MILYPAIDLKDGECVRLVQGDMARVTVFNEDPVAQAKAFETHGFAWLHIVDLNGAFEGHPVNGEVVGSILKNVSLSIQLGGGIRSMKTAGYWIDAGVRRIVLGTAAVRDPEFVRTACREFPGQVAVGLDAKDGRVAVQGWAEVTELSVAEVAGRFADAGVAAVIFTDIGRDGVLTGVNVDATVTLSKQTSIPVIASGGVSSIDDLRALKRSNADNIDGVISGRALYDGRLDPSEALTLLAEDGDA